MPYFISAAFSALATYLFLPPVLGILQNAGFARPNYAGTMVPVGAGLSFVLGSSVGLGASLYGDAVPSAATLLMWMTAVSFAFLGLLDDFAGNREVTGARHLITFWRHGRVTTGTLKALFGGFLALVASSLTQPSPWEVILGALVVALSANFVNLLDLRPGRAGKGFLILASTIYAASREPTASLLAPFAASLLVYLPVDLAAKGMMGDTGSNFLGAAAGVAALLSLSPSGKVIFALFLIAIHIYAEKRSLSETIEKVRVLRALDLLGRSRK